jgi:hypothetical protein
MHGGRWRGRREGAASRASWGVPLGASVLSALVIVGPGLGRGYLLVRDMVFVPDPPLTARLLGLGHENARAVPSDLVVALASQVLPGQVLQKLVLLALLVAAGAGAAGLVPRAPAAGTAAALVAIWNPFVGERLAMGQWALLVGYAALPWVLRGVVDVTRGDPARPGARRMLAVALVVGSLGGGLAWVTLGVGLVAGAVAVAATPVTRREVTRRAWWAGLLWLLLALPWAVPALTRPHGLTSDPAGFAVFAPRSDTVLGVVVSLLTGGATWNSTVVPPGRDTLVGGVAALLLLGWAVAGFVVTRAGRAPVLDAGAAGYRVPVVVAGGVGLALGLASTWPAVLEPLAGVPGGGLLRDGSRQLGPWLLVAAVGCGWGVHWLGRQHLPRALVWIVAAAPVAVLPSLGWGLSGVFAPVTYPSDVRAAAATLGAAEQPGAVAVLPFEAYRRYDWNGGLSSMTPWSRLVDRRVVASSDLVVVLPNGSARVAGEDEYAAQVGRALTAPRPGAALGRLGVRWVLVDAPGVAAPAGTSVLSRGPHVTLLQVDAPVDAAWPQRLDPPTAPVVAGDLVWLAACLGAVWWTRRRTSRGSAEEPTTIR